MKAIFALLAAVAMIGSAAAWDISEELQYTYIKDVFEQAGTDETMPQIVGAQSGAFFNEPSVYCPFPVADGNHDPVCYTLGAAYNKLESVTLDQTINQNYEEDLSHNNFYATLTQSGYSLMETHAQDGIDNAVPEIKGSSTASQQLNLGGGFTYTAAEFDSKAITGVKSTDPKTNNWVITDLADNNLAEVNAEDCGAGEFMKAYMGAKVMADIQQDYEGSSWDDATYSGGIQMWAGFKSACDPDCANPIVSSVTGSAATALFPGYGDYYFWEGYTDEDPNNDDSQLLFWETEINKLDSFWGNDNDNIMYSYQDPF